MTSDEKQRLTDHLAEKVCGWTREGDYWQMPNGGRWHVHGWCPLDYARHAEVVMEAWGKFGTYRIESISKTLVEAVAWRGKIQGFGSARDWLEAVCLAIARASGWVEEKNERLGVC